MADKSLDLLRESDCQNGVKFRQQNESADATTNYRFSTGLNH
jgi:hypothetical protein